MAHLTPRFSTNRSVREYTERYYIPSAKKYRLRYAQNCAFANAIISWKKELSQKWHELRFGETKVECFGENYLFKVQLFFGTMDPLKIAVELFSNETKHLPYQTLEMTRADELDHSRESAIYTAFVPNSCPSKNYTPRIIPFFEGVSVPLEESHILWQK